MEYVIGGNWCWLLLVGDARRWLEFDVMLDWLELVLELSMIDVALDVVGGISAGYDVEITRIQLATINTHTIFPVTLMCFLHS